MDDASSRIGDTRPLPTMNALRRPPAAAEARRVLAGKEDVMVALPWIHAIAASVREAQAEERQRRDDRQTTLRATARAGAKVAGKLGLGLAAVQARRAVEEAAARDAREREERRMKRVHKESQRRLLAAEQRRKRGIYS